MPLSTPLSAGLSTLLSRGISGPEFGFNPLSLDPLLLLDGAQGVYGAYQSPTLDWDAVAGESVVGPDPVVTRAGVATYQDAAGDIVLANENEIRVDHSLGYPAFLIEPAATNAGRFPAVGAGWRVEGPSGVWDISVPDHPTLKAHDGRPMADVQFAYSGPGGGGAARELGNVSATSGETYTATVDLAASTFAGGNDAVTLGIYNDGWAMTDVSYEILSGPGSAATDTGSLIAFSGLSATEVTRVRITATAYQTGIVRIYAYAKTSSASQSASVGMALGCPQLEEGLFPTSYIPTTDADVTRNADLVSISGQDFADIRDVNKGTIYAEFVAPGGADPNAVYVAALIHEDNDNYTRIYRWDDKIGSNHKVGGISVTSSHVTQIGAIGRGVLSYDSSGMEVANEGVLGSPYVGEGRQLNADVLWIGSQAGGQVLNGHIKRLIYWPYTSAELES